MRPGTLAAMTARDWSIARSYKLALILDAVFTIVNLIAFFFISKTFEGAQTADLGGAPSYFAFATVGMAMTLVIQSASVGMGTRVREEQLTGTLEALLVQPVSPIEISLGLAGFPFLFAIGRACLYILVAGGLLGVDFGNASWPGFFLILIGAGAALSAIGIALGAVILLLQRGEGIAALATFGMGILGGALFPIDVLPGWVQAISGVLPTTFSFAGLRQALFTGTSWDDDLLRLLIFACAAIPAAALLFNGALERARRVGSLGRY